MYVLIQFLWDIFKNIMKKVQLLFMIIFPFVLSTWWTSWVDPILKMFKEHDVSGDLINIVMYGMPAYFAVMSYMYFSSKSSSETSKELRSALKLREYEIDRLKDRISKLEKSLGETNK